MSFNNNYIDEDLSKSELEDSHDIHIDENISLDNGNIGNGDKHSNKDFNKIDYNKSDEEIINSPIENISSATKGNHDSSMSNVETHLEKSVEILLDEGKDQTCKSVTDQSKGNDIDINLETVNVKTEIKIHGDIENETTNLEVKENDFVPVSSFRSESDSDLKLIKENDEVLLNKDDLTTDDSHENIRSTDNVPQDSSSHSGSSAADIDTRVTETSTIDMTTPTSDAATIANDPDNFIDILGNGLLTKRVIVKGLGRETRPSHGDSVTIEYKAWNSSNEQFTDTQETFVIGDGDMIQAFDLALCLAEMQELFELQTDARFAYGVHGMLPDVKPHEAVKYHIKLLSAEDAPDYTTYNYNDRMDAADKKRERGNWLYRREEFPYAVNSYSRAIKIIESDPDFKKSYNDPSKADMFDLFVKVTNNMAASQLKLESYDSVIETCNTILSYDPDNVKALFRKGKALNAKGSYDEAIVNLKKAFDKDKKNKLIANEIQKCMKLKKDEDDRNASFCRRMFATGSGSDQTGRGAAAPEAGGWRRALYASSPYVGAALVTVLSLFLASAAMARSKGV